MLGHTGSDHRGIATPNRHFMESAFCRPWRQRDKGEAEDPKQWVFTALILAVLALLSFIVIVGGA